MPQPVRSEDPGADVKVNADPPAHRNATIERRIIALIVNGQWRPSQYFTEAALAKILNCSRTPVREVLAGLVRIGFLKRVPNYGTTVRESSGAEIDEMWNLRLQYEPDAAAGVAANPQGRADRIKVLREIVEKMKAAFEKDMFEYLDADLEFHCTLFSFSGRRVLVEHLLESIMFRLIISGAGSIDTKIIGDVIRDHEAVVDAIEAGSPDKARQAMEKHLNRAREHMQSLRPVPIVMRPWRAGYAGLAVAGR